MTPVLNLWVMKRLSWLAVQWSLEPGDTGDRTACNVSVPVLPYVLGHRLGGLLKFSRSVFFRTGLCLVPAVRFVYVATDAPVSEGKAEVDCTAGLTRKFGADAIDLLNKLLESEVAGHGFGSVLGNLGFMG